MKSHPTIYRGTQFRSRLEARWAAFFDLVGWRWRYEPFDLEGWTPDFLLSRACTDDVLIEVKPLVFRGDEQDFTIDRCPATRPDVLAAAKMVIKPNSQEGLAEFIEQLIADQNESANRRGEEAVA